MTGDYVFQELTMLVLPLVVLNNPPRLATAAVTAAVAVRNQGLKEQKRGYNIYNVSERHLSLHGGLALVGWALTAPMGQYSFIFRPARWSKAIIVSS